MELVLPMRDAKRKWAVDIALEVLDLVRKAEADHSLFVWPDGRVAIRPFHAFHAEVEFESLVGVYDRSADVTAIADDLMAMNDQRAQIRGGKRRKDDEPISRKKAGMTIKRSRAA